MAYAEMPNYDSKYSISPVDSSFSFSNREEDKEEFVVTNSETEEQVLVIEWREALNEFQEISVSGSNAPDLSEEQKQHLAQAAEKVQTGSNSEAVFSHLLSALLD